MTTEIYLQALQAHLEQMATNPPIDESEDDLLKGWGLACNEFLRLVTTLRKTVESAKTP